jgi:tetratricopeptide (TPR) repeat protein
VRFHSSISVGQLFDVLLPAAVAVAIICSTWVLTDARRRGLKRYALGAWTLSTLLLPFTFLPLYLLARMWRSTVIAKLRPLRSRLALPIVYAAVLTTLAALYFRHDYHSLDAQLARASGAKLHEQHERAASAYRAALVHADEPHTHKLLGLELAAMQQWPEALIELRSAERGGEPDVALPYHIALVLDALDQHDAAISAYHRFLAGELCMQAAPDVRCDAARERVMQPVAALPTK